jgi:hypothetical protein
MCGENDLRLSGGFEVACEPDSGIGTKPKFMNHPVPLVINIPEVYWVVPSRPISVWTLQSGSGEVEIKG